MVKQLTEKIIKCVDCGNDFVFSVRDQQYFKQMDFAAPKRCKFCKEAKKKRYECFETGHIDC